MPIEIPKGRWAPDKPLPTIRPGSRRLSLALASSLVLTLSACAAVTPPPRFAPISPDDAKGPEGAVPPAKPMLSGDGELADRSVTAAPAAEDMPDLPLNVPSAAPAAHPGHVHPGTTSLPEAAVYACPTHPQVSVKEPGNCPICGTALVRTAAKPQEPRR